MRLISTGKSTVLSSFPYFDAQTSYEHANGETTDFQFFKGQKVFVEINKKSGLELLRIKEDQKKFELQKVFKVKVNNAYCVACSKQSYRDMAIGLSNGGIKLYSFGGVKVEHSFAPSNIRDGVMYLDYNMTDDYIAAVLESGQINMYGTKTKAMLNGFYIDGSSTLARFHPTNQFHLTIASFKGAVTLFDINSKLKLFHSPKAHVAPCRDLCVSPANTDTIISVGYDCVINVFDMRRKKRQFQVEYSHPLSTVAISESGNYFCVGDLKGELISFDLRYPSKYLATKKVHDCAVVRVAFEPTENKNDNKGIGLQGLVKQLSDLEDMPDVEIVEETNDGKKRMRDSFLDYVDFHTTKTLPTTSSGLNIRRDSFDWEGCDLLPRQILSTNAESATKEFYNSTNVNMKPRYAVSVEKPFPLEASNKARDRYSGVLTDAARLGKLNQIQEESGRNYRLLGTGALTYNNDLSSGSDKANPSNSKPNTNNIFTKTSENRKSITISTHTFDPKSNTNNNLAPTSENPKSTTRTTRTSINVSTVPKSNDNQENNFSNVSLQIEDLRNDMIARFQTLESEIKFNAETNKWHIFTQASNLWNRQIDTIEEIRDALSILLQTDPFVTEFMRLREENALLKAQLNDTSNQ